MGTRPARRILVIAHPTASSSTLPTSVAARVADRAATRVLVVAPARSWDATVRPLQACVAALAAAGIDAEGMVGDADPLQAVRDALRVFPADLLLSTTSDVAERVRERFSLPTEAALAA